VKIPKKTYDSICLMMPPTPSSVVTTMASALTTLTPTPTSASTTSIVTTKIFFALTDSRSSSRSLTPDLLAQWRASSNNALLFPILLIVFPRLYPLYAFSNQSRSVHYLASSLVLACPLGLLPVALASTCSHLLFCLHRAARQSCCLGRC